MNINCGHGISPCMLISHNILNTSTNGRNMKEEQTSLEESYGMKGQMSAKILKKKSKYKYWKFKKGKQV